MVDIIKTCEGDENSCCPFACIEMSEQAQNYGCLPSSYEIIQMRVNHGKTWACHNAPTKGCVGAIKHLKERNLPYDIIDDTLITEKDDWSIYVE